MTNLVLQSFGKESEYKRAILTILSYYAYTSLPVEQSKVILFTDQPDYFKPYLDIIPVQYILLTPEKIKQMRGKIDFLHRMKIALIEEAFGLIEGAMLYADSDTFFIADPTPLVQQLTPQKSFMHIWEYQFESMRHLALPAGRTFRDFLTLIESKTFRLADGTMTKISPQDASWNAGVMMFHPAHKQLIQDVYILTEQFYPPTQNHASEQYAFSVILQKNTQLSPCDAVIYHYWYRIKKQIIDIFLEHKLGDSWVCLPLSQKLLQVKEWTTLLPDYFEKHILTVKDNAIQAFNENDFSKGYYYAFQAIVQKPFDTDFIKNVLYHTKRRFVKKQI